MSIKATFSSNQSIYNGINGLKFQECLLFLHHLILKIFITLKHLLEHISRQKEHNQRILLIFQHTLQI